jgi:methionyl-tRNA synthetase
MPKKGDEMRAQLGLPPIETGKDLLAVGLLAPLPGRQLAHGSALFPTVDEDRSRSLLQKLTPKIEAAPAPAPTAAPAPAAAPASAPTAAPAPAAAPPAPAHITYDQFATVDLRVGVVRTCERVPKKDKLLRLTVDVGEPEPRSIVAGLALSFQPEQLVGRRVVVVANLAPREFGKGLVSHGMLLATGPSDKLTLATVDGDVEPGARLK